MRDMELRFLADETAERIDQMVNRVAAGEGTVSADQFVKDLIELLPVQKMQTDTVKRRVEGLYLAGEILWHKALELTANDRNEVIRRARLKPLSHYHYLTGSLEPKSNVLTRDDYLNDPSTALVKLKDDIMGLVSIFPTLRKTSKTPA